MQNRIKSRPCKICGSTTHTASRCVKRPKKTGSKSSLRKKVNVAKCKTIKKKPISRTKVKKQLDKLVKDFVKRRDDYTCQHCGAKVEGSNCHASHVFPVGAHANMQFDPLNLKCLCYHCHINWWHKNPLEAYAWFISAFPDRYQYLEQRKLTATKLSTYELLEIIERYKK